MLAVGCLQAGLYAQNDDESVFEGDLTKTIEFISSDSDPNTVHGFNPNRAYEPGVSEVLETEQQESPEVAAAVVEETEAREIDAPTAAKAKEVYLQLRNSITKEDVEQEAVIATPAVIASKDKAESQIMWWLVWLIGCIVGLGVIIVLLRSMRRRKQLKRRSNRRSRRQATVEKRTDMATDAVAKDDESKSDDEDDPARWSKKPRRRRSSKSRRSSDSDSSDKKSKEVAFFKKEGPIKQEPPRRPRHGSHGPMQMPGMPGMPMHGMPPHIHGRRRGPPPQIIYVPVMPMQPHPHDPNDQPQPEARPLPPTDKRDDKDTKKPEQE